jgi:hypothetical protein
VPRFPATHCVTLDANVVRRISDDHLGQAVLHQKFITGTLLQWDGTDANDYSEHLPVE